MEVEAMIMPPRTRLHELKSSADFSSEEFNHSIKTWVNMASLLVKQGNMAESKQDDENAYISYVRACLIITKIIPHQALYHTMMNDIVCIDLRQKILGIISRIGHLERRLLKRFEQENQQYLAGTKPSSSVSVSKSTASCLNSSSLTVTPGRDSERKADCEQDIEQDSPIQMLSFKQIGDDEDEEASGEEIAEEFVEMKYEFSSGNGVALELDPQDYAKQQQQQQQQQEQSSSSGSDKGGVVPTLRKKSSNDDERPSLLLSPECQPNFSTMPSALFAREREGSHVRRCSSTESVGISVHFPSIMALATASANDSPRLSVCAPTTSRRNDKRCSTMGMPDMDRVDIKERLPDYRGTASSIDEGDKERAQYARDILKSRFTNRRTMSFESNHFHANNNSGISNNPDGTLPKTTGSQLRKSNSISRIASSSRGAKDVPPTPRLSVQNLKSNGSLSATSLNTHMSLSSESINQSAPSSVSSTPFTSPQLRSTSPYMPTSGFVVHGEHGQGHGHSYSLASIASGSTMAMTEPSSQRSVRLPTTATVASNSAARSQSANNNSTSPKSHQPPVRSIHQQSSSTSCSTSYTNASTITAESATTTSSASSPTLISMATWATVTTGKKVGLLRKIRSKPKMKDQLFDIVATPTPVPSPPPHLLQQQQQYQQQHQQQLMSLITGQSRQHSGPMP